MTKKELLHLINKCINDHNNLNEGAIKGTRTIAKNIVDKFKKFYTASNINKDIIDYIANNTKSPNKNFFKNNVKNLSTDATFIIGDAYALSDFLNEKFFDKLYPNDSPLPIKIVPTDKHIAAFHKDYNEKNDGYIEINIFKYLLSVKKGQAFNLYAPHAFIEPKKIDYNHLINTLEHELIHYEQHLRANVKDGDLRHGINDKEIRLMKQSQPTIQRGESLLTYNNRVDYYNTKVEIMAHAKNTASRYIQNYINISKSQYPNYSNQELKAFILKQPITSNYIKKAFPEIRYLTPSSKKLFLKYLGEYLQSDNISDYIDNPSPNTSSPQSITSIKPPVN